jgi:hypothetical protein
MSQALQVYSITAPGFYGLNTQDSSLDLASGFALTANNAVIDQYGRVGARKGWTALNSSIPANLGANDIKAIAELIDRDGTSYVLCAGNQRLWKYASGVLTQLTFNGVGTAPTITNDNWSTAYLDGDMYFYQLGHVPLGFDPAASTTTYYRVDQESGYNGTVQQANIVISALGRIWNAETTTDKVTLQWSDLKNPHKFGSGTAGTLDTTTVWPKGGDTITALASHNNFLFIFGKRNILVYQGANNPATMSLYDTITGIGCIARDSVVETGTDVIFLSETGVRSILRTIQEKSAPLRDLSKNVRNDLMNIVAGETLSNIKAVYNPREAFYLLTLPSVKTVYCFDMKTALQDGSARVTTWDSIAPASFCQKADGTLLMGKAGYLAYYTGYTDNGESYRFQYYTNHTDLGAPSITSVLKKLSAVVIGGSNQDVFMKWAYDFTGNFQSSTASIPSQGVSLFGVAEYNTTAEYSGGTALQTLYTYPTGSGKVIQTGYESVIYGSALSIQKLEIQAKNGRLG